MDNLEELSTMGTQDTGHINVRENRRVNQEWTIWRNCQQWAHKTQDKKKQPQHNRQNEKDEQR